MQFGRVFLVVFGLALIANFSEAQIRKSPVSSKFRVPKISKRKAQIVCPIFIHSQYPYQGLGIKMGDPFAFTYKYYPNENWAFAIDAGKAASGLYNKYYRSVYASYLQDTLSEGETLSYLTHLAKQDWLVEAKFLYQWDAEAISEGLQLYAGLGWQWRNTLLSYDYLYDDQVLGTSTESRFGNFERRRFTYGPVGILGFEYAYFSLPLSAFIEIEWFTDALLDPGYNRFQGGVGLRYVF